MKWSIDPVAILQYPVGCFISTFTLLSLLACLQPACFVILTSSFIIPSPKLNDGDSQDKKYIGVGEIVWVIKHPSQVNNKSFKTSLIYSLNIYGRL
jgi:hypothetical protein